MLECRACQWRMLNAFILPQSTPSLATTRTALTRRNPRSIPSSLARHPPIRSAHTRLETEGPESRRTSDDGSLPSTNEVTSTTDVARPRRSGFQTNSFIPFKSKADRMREWKDLKELPLRPWEKDHIAARIRKVRDEVSQPQIEQHAQDTPKGAQQDTTKAESDASPPEALSEAEKRLQRQNEKNWAKELEYLSDPLELSERVHRYLKDGHTASAYGLARLGSRRMSNVVSWNHIIDWNMSQHKINEAFNVYNEMKKRQQQPDSHTFILLLRGLANHTHLPNALERALSLHTSMFAPNSPVKPRIMHTNAALKVCAKAGDLDTIWGLVARLPDTGTGAPDNLTYTTILNAIARHVIDVKGTADDKRQVITQCNTAIVQGRQVWQAVIQRWRAGDIAVDEILVCAMGRLLLTGVKTQDWDDILSLVEQTMQIPRQSAPLGTQERIEERRAANEDEVHAAHLGAQARWRHHGVDAGREFDPPSVSSETDDTFAPTKPSASLLYATPGSNALSLILEACQKTVNKRAADRYWTLLTDPNGSYALLPDMNNYAQYLRVLRQSHSSAQISTLLERCERETAARRARQPDNPHITDLSNKIFLIAMSACNRDRDSPSVSKHATAIFDMMLKYCGETPPPRAVNLYLSLLFSRERPVEEWVEGLERGTRASYELQSAYQYKPSEYKWRTETLEFIETVVFAYSRFFADSRVNTKDYRPWVKRQGTLRAWLERNHRVKTPEYNASKAVQLAADDPGRAKWAGSSPTTWHRNPRPWHDAGAEAWEFQGETPQANESRFRRTRT